MSNNNVQRVLSVGLKSAQQLQLVGQKPLGFVSANIENNNL